MRYILSLFICTISLTLVSCSGDEVDSPTIKEETIQEEMKLPDVGIYNSSEGLTTVVRDVWCLKEESLCSLEPNPPEDLLMGIQPLRVEPGEVFSMSITYDASRTFQSDHVFFPDIIELVQRKSGEEEGKLIEVVDMEAVAPEEEGLYYYSLKLQWDGELTGQVYLAFSIRVE